MIRPFLRDMINNHREPLKFKNPTGKIIGEWKIQLTMQINFISSLYTVEISTMDSKSKNLELLMGSETDDIIKELSKSFLQGYQEGLEKKMRGSEFVFESLYKTRLKEVNHT